MGDYDYERREIERVLTSGRETDEMIFHIKVTATARGSGTSMQSQTKWLNLTERQLHALLNATFPEA